MLRYLPFLLVLAVWIYAFIDCLNTPENEVRKLPKVLWVIIILLLGQVLVGPIVWFAVGRPRRNAPYGATKPQERRWVAPDDNPDFLNSLQQRMRSAPDGARDGEDAEARESGGTGEADGTASGDADAGTDEDGGVRDSGRDDGSGSGDDENSKNSKSSEGSENSKNPDNNDPPSAGR